MSSAATSSGKYVHRRTREHVRGCLLGGAVGDALGAPVEFMSWEQIARRFGPRGITEFADAYGCVGAITDDTQMTLFTAEGVLRGIVRWNEKGIGGPMSTLPHAYLRWLYTQEHRLPAHLDEFRRELVLGNDRDVSSGWLLSVNALHHQRAPGNTCLAALRNSETGTRERPLNDSKGCGGVMRVAPIALFSADAETCYRTACDAAALTHGHPTGWIAAGALAFMLAQIRDGADLAEAVEATLERLRRQQSHEETSRALSVALAVWRSGEEPGPDSVARVGKGWIAEEALAIGVYAALANGGDFESGVRLSVNHSGDSDSTGSIAGQILGLALGEDAIPERWLAHLELREEITRLADDIVIEHRDGDEWWDRYPGY